MKKFFLFSVLFTFLSVFSYAQSDSILLAHTKWEVTRLAPGIRLRHFWFDHSLFSSPQNITILDVKLTHKNSVHIAADPQTLKLTSAFGEEQGAFAALNGTFFDTKNGGSVDYVRVEGKEVNETRLNNKDHARGLHQKSALVMDGH